MLRFLVTRGHPVGCRAFAQGGSDLSAAIQEAIQQAVSNKKNTLVAVRKMLEAKKPAPTAKPQPDASKLLRRPVAVMGPRKPYALRPRMLKSTGVSIVVLT